jgi:hypothetical protein
MFDPIHYRITAASGWFALGWINNPEGVETGAIWENKRVVVFRRRFLSS